MQHCGDWCRGFVSRVKKGFIGILGGLTFLHAVLCQESLVVDTNVGSYRGKYSDPTVVTWQGIPYGAPTNGSRRFRPPGRAAVRPSGKVFNATSFGPQCVQNANPSYCRLAQGMIDTTLDGEDCLNLNIWAPSNHSQSSNKTSKGSAVLLWVFGGGNQFGSSNLPLYDGTNFVRDNSDLIFVSINYRLSIFGAPVGSGVPIQEMNLGLLDQRLAIEWVYNNIRHFGGDPERITIFGQSAGAINVGTYAYAHEYDPIVAGIIMQSGSELVYSQTLQEYNSTAGSLIWNTIANSSGCATNVTQAALFECMQNVPVERLTATLTNTSTDITGSFVAQIDNVTVYGDYPARTMDGHFAKVPVLIGSTQNESTLLTTGSEAFMELYTLIGLTCPAAVVADGRTNNSVPAWQYRYLGEFPNLNTDPALGVYHGSELPLVFGTYNLSASRAPSTRAEIELSRHMQGAWAAFAKDPVAGLSKYGWPKWNASGSTLVELGANNQSTPSFVRTNTYNKDCGTFYPALSRSAQ